MIRATDIHSLTDFTRNAKTYIRQIKESKNQDAESFQRMIDELDHVRFIAALRESESAVRNGQIQDIDQAFGHSRG